MYVINKLWFDIVVIVYNEGTKKIQERASFNCVYWCVIYLIYIKNFL